MAKTIATVSGTALAPGVSRNGNLYTRDNIATAVSRAQQRIDAGRHPIGMYTHHDTMKTADLVGRVTKVWQDEDGSAKFTAAIADTPTGRNIASLLDTSDGEPAFLRGVSIRGNWAGPVRRVKTADGGAETSTGLEFGRLDYTSEPGVAAAGVDDYAPAADDPDESGGHYTISESAPEARVTAITEEAAPADGAAGDVDEAAKTAPPGAAYADPGYLDADGNQVSKSGKPGVKRYPLDIPARVRAAWSYINQKANAAQYSASQLKRIKGKIKAAMSRAGAKVTAEGWTIWPAELITESAVDECYAMEKSGGGGSFSITATNGPVNVSVSSYCIDPADLELILPAAAGSAFAALKNLDPDMDADIDIPGVGTGSDTDHDAGESAPDEEVAETSPQDPAPDPDADPQEDKEVPAMADTATPAVEAAPVAATDPKVIQEAVNAALAADRKARKTEKAAREAKAAKKAAKAAESAPAGEVTESEGDKIARLVKEGIAEAMGGSTEVAETADEKVARLVKEGITAEVQRLTESGSGPGRKGLVTEHTAARAAVIPAELPFKDGKIIPSEEWTDDQNRAVGHTMEQYVLGSRASV